MYRALIAEDEPLHRRALAKMVEQAGQEVVVAALAADGEEALARLGEARFDLVLTDIRMPKVDGLALAARIAEGCRATRVIVISGYADFSYAQQGLRHGVVDYLLKPVKQEDLNRALAAAVLDLGEPPSVQAERWFSPDTIAAFQELAGAVDLLDETRAVETAGRLWAGLGDEPNPRQQGRLAGEILRALAARYPDLHTAPGELRQVPSAAEENGEAVQEALAGQIRALVARLSEQRGSAGRKLIQQVKAFVASNYHRDIGLADAAGAVHLNPSYLSVLFKEVTGENFSSYLTRIRMDQARRLLEDPGTRIYEVAAAVGFADQAYFSRLFKQRVGVGPAEYRRRLGI